MSDKTCSKNKGDIAIIGMACRFPNAKNYNEFWENLKNGVNSIKEIPAERWDINKYYSQDINEPNKSISKWCGLIDDFDKFDNEFFNISPREAELIDPQQRLLLEEAWHCMEDSGICLTELQKKRTLVYIGVMAMDNLNLAGNTQIPIDTYSAIGSYSGILANRVSYALGLSGNSHSLDAACASSLVTVHHAKQALLTHQADYAFAGAVSLNFHPFKYISFSKSRMLSPDGQCKTFDKDANGYVPGDGVAILLLQRLADAIESGSHIYGIIKGSAVNYTRSKLMITAPEVKAQYDVISSAYQDANIKPDSITYIEAHGTGTSLGDPIEVEALTRVFKKHTEKKDFCKIGSVKTNIGHTEAAAGMAGIIKVLMMFKHKKIPSILNFQKVNPVINFDDSPFAVSVKLSNWKNKLPLRAGISSFGMGGVNSHFVLEQSLVKKLKQEKNKQPHPFLISAKSEESLKAMISDWQTFMKSKDYKKYSLNDISATLDAGRETFPFRFGCIAESHDELESFLSAAPHTFSKQNRPRLCLRIGEYAWKGWQEIKPFFADNTYFKEEIERIETVLEKLNVAQAIYKGFRATTWTSDNYKLYRFMTSYAFLNSFFQTSGVIPDLLAGEVKNSGFWTALTISKIIKCEDVLAVLSGQKNNSDIEFARPSFPFFDPVSQKNINPFYFHAEYIHSLSDNLSISKQATDFYLSKTKALLENQFTFKKYIEEWDTILKKTGRDIHKIIGDKEGMFKKEKKLFALIVANCIRKLNQKWNLSEKQIDASLEFYEILDLITDNVMPKETVVELFRNEKPDFKAAADILNQNQKNMNIKNPYKIIRNQKLNEIGKVAGWLKNTKNTIIVNPEDMLCLDFGRLNTFGSIKDSVFTDMGDDVAVLQKRLMLKLWLKGVDIDFKKLYPERTFQKVPLPVYQFKGKRHLLPVSGVREQGSGVGEYAAKLHPLLHRNTSDLLEQRFSSTFTGNEFFLADHVVKGKKVLPGVVYLEMARVAVEQAVGVSKDEQATILLKNVVWARPIAVNDKPVHVHIRLFPEESGEIGYEIYSQPDAKEAESVVHSQGIAALNTVDEIPPLDIESLKVKCDHKILSSYDCYEAFSKVSLEYGPGHRGIEKIYVGEGKALAKLKLPASVSDTDDKFVMHPSLMDSALQASIGLTIGGLIIGSGKLEPALPFALQQLEVFDRCTSSMWAFVKYSIERLADDKVKKLNIDLCDEKGCVCVRMKGFSSRMFRQDLLAAAVPSEIPAKFQAGLTMLSPVWNRFEVKKKDIFPAETDHILIVGGVENTSKKILQLYPQAAVFAIQPMDTIDTIAKRLKKQGVIDHIIWIAPYDSLKPAEYETLIQEQEKGVILLFKMIKAALSLGYGSNNLGWSIITTRTESVYKNNSVNPVHASIHGLTGSMAKEHPRWKVRLVDLETDYDLPINKIFSLPYDPRGHAFVLRNGQWLRRKLIVTNNFTSGNTFYRNKGVYLVIGGAGNIGFAWSEYMIRTYNARIIWIGRRKKDADISSKIDSLAALGHTPLYISADATDLKAIQSAYKKIKKRYSKIHGIIHSSLVFSEHLIQDMDETEFGASLFAKVDTSVRMFEVFRKDPPDFFIFFSSVISFIKNTKQSHYAAGCTFTDAFAHWLSNELECTVKVINWGYWKNDVLAESYNNLEQIGIGLIEPHEAMQSLEMFLQSAQNQIGLMKIKSSLEIEGINNQESITVYPESIPLNIEKIRASIFKQFVDIPNINFDVNEEMEHLLCKFLWAHLQFITKKELHDLYDRWFEESLAVFKQRNYSGNDIVISNIDALWEEWDIKKESWLKNSDIKAHVILVETTLRSLPEILTGKIPSTDIMFPKSSMKLVEGIYKNNKVADYFNQVMGNTLSVYIEERLRQNSSSQIRILEIGAGTGGTSAVIFDKLKPYKENISEYCYTDISKAFLMHAEKEYGEKQPYLTYKIFNVEKSVKAQGIDVAGYDVVIAANVLHATRDIRQTLRNAKAIIKRNGLILLNELSSNSLFFHLTFGLLEGWWLYDDPVLRISGCPGLYPQTWHKVLAQEGFENILFPTEQAHDLGQQIIIAESNGIVRQKREAKIKHKVHKAISIKEKNINPALQHRTISETMDVNDKMIEDHVISIIIESIAKSLKMESEMIRYNRSFSEYGVDSIIGINLVQLIGRTLSIELQTTVIFDYSSVNKLTKYILSQYKNIIAKALEKDIRRINISHDVTPTEEKKTVFADSRRFLKKVAPVATKKKFADKSIAIIGMSARFPGAEGIHEFWKNLVKGKNCITKIPKDRWDSEAFYGDHTKEKNRTNVKWGGFIDGIGDFDPMFFGISPREAELMDPQQRLLMLYIWKALEDSGTIPKELAESNTGVFIAAAPSEYSNVVPISFDNPFTMGAILPSMLPSRISYILNLNGPSEYCDTACSSTIVALNHAIFAIHSNQCEQAIVGAANLILSPIQFNILESIDFFSKNGKAKSFQAEADGCVISEGIGAVIIKSLEKAVNDNDRIYAVIKATGISHGGKGISFTAPTGRGMKAAMFQTYQASGIDPQTVSYMEAHGTATPMGDAIEIDALKSGYNEIAAGHADKLQIESPCYISSLKPCIGHAIIASGMAALIKVVMALNNKLIPGLPGFKNLNENISLKGTRFKITAQNHKWKVLTDTDGKKLPRRAAINSYGFGGVNAHAIIEEYVEQGTKEEINCTVQRPLCTKADELQIFVLSARNEKQLNVYAKSMANFLENAGSYQKTIDSYEKFLSEKLTTDLLKFASDILKVKEDNIDLDCNLTEYGFEPVSLTQYCERINEKYDLKIIPQIFTGYSSIGSFAEYLINEYKQYLIRFYPESLRETEKKGNESRIELTDISYTLQIGREPMEYRLAIVVSNKEELIKGLNTYLQSVQKNGKLGVSLPIFTGNREKDYQEIKNLFSGNIGDTVLQTLLKEKNPGKLANYWVKGFDIPWEVLYKGKNVRKIWLPTYPFEKKRYWLTESVSADNIASQPLMQVSVKKKKSSEKLLRKEESVEEKFLDTVCKIFIDKLKLEQIASDKNLIQYGFDSILFTRFTNEFNKQFNLKLKPADFFDHPSINSFVSYVNKAHRQALVEYYGRCSIETSDSDLNKEDKGNNKWKEGKI